MAVKDGLPSTDFSRMNREYIKAVAGEGGGPGLPAVTEADNGKILGVVNGAWGAMDVPSGSGEATIASIDVTNVLPNGKTMHHFGYFVYLSEEGNSIDCISDDSLVFPFVSGNPTYIKINSGESTDGDYMRASNIAVTGGIEADGEYLTISGEGTVTITWIVT